jgi:hypothetical protein
MKEYNNGYRMSEDWMHILKQAKVLRGPESQGITKNTYTMHET